MKKVLLVFLLVASCVFGQKIEAGGGHSISLSKDGKLYSWGRNFAGQLGNGTTTDSSIPVVVDMSGVLKGKTVTSISVGRAQTFVLTNDGKIYAWGCNSAGELGNGTTTHGSNIPIAVDMSGVLKDKTIIAISAGNYHAIALTSDGKLYAWGRNMKGQLGNGTTTDSNVPVAVDMSGTLKGKTVKAISAGYLHTVVLTSDGKVYAWGNNSPDGKNTSGQLGNGTITDSNVPVAVDMSGVLKDKIVTTVSAGYGHTVALTNDGKVYAWGRNYLGPLGTGNKTDSNVPVAVDMSGVLKGKTVTSISAHNTTQTIVLTSDGKVYAWGDNNVGQLGNGTTAISYVPVAVDVNGGLSGKTVTAISSGEGHTLALTSDGKVYAWGDNGGGKLGNGTTTNSSVPVEVTGLNLLGTEENKTIKPTAFALLQNYPNPFNPATVISYKQAVPGNVELKVFNMLGQEVCTLVNENQKAGEYSVSFDAAKYNLPSGTYFYRIKTNNFSETKKMLLIK